MSVTNEQLFLTPLAEQDPKVAEIMKNEEQRQRSSINLIASENFTSRAVMDALGSVMSNKYSEGYPGARYYGGNQFIDQIETLCQERALKAFNVTADKWGVNVQCLSGSPANLEVYQAIMPPHSRLMGLDLPSGGHLSHGYQTDARKISAVSTYFESMPYRVDPETGIIDYDTLAKNAQLFRPKVLVAGTSAYCRLIDYKRMREIADSVNAYLMVDMAHISGLVSAGVIPSPFEYADIVTTTTHKSLRGPRGAMIFFRRGLRKHDKKGNPVYYDLEDKINFSVFPGHQGGPHNHTITALAVALKQCDTPAYKAYQAQVVKNAKACENEFKKLGYKLAADGTDSHMVLVNVKSKHGIDGARAERVLELINVVTNKNTLPSDKSALSPSGIRVGTPAMTTRGFKEQDFLRVVDFIDRALTIAADLQKSLPKEANKLKDFKAALGEGENIPELAALKKEVIEWTSALPLAA
ncbi:glycine hydroxymethyltransferase [Schizosaccharomyces japonicus yFS275]|uniref:Serine hydroxymethyltransferase n=1 Tax=Schizosaccharomyces japonicus (strain yFS275 / FY16936) TaxID=402676 RepID=B6JYU6_SCHJY|nr:glycine hydroxymethyltransferase [Schizosaccharomyces japonicus yFS275]EEB06714.1 glycine hydroxymethyltransferase [Schizosaccharomyces japonicus yFS275]